MAEVDIYCEIMFLKQFHYLFTWEMALGSTAQNLYKRIRLQN